MKAPTIKDIEKFVTKNSWFKADDDEEGWISFTTRDNGDMDRERPGREDIAKAKSLGRDLKKKYGDTISVSVDYVDEWTVLDVGIKRAEEAVRTSDLLRRLEEASKPKIQWKSKTAEEYELYSSEEGSGKAASDMNKAMKKVASEISKIVAGAPSPDDRGEGEKWWGKKVASLYSKIVRPVMMKHSNTGATDTEPRYHVVQGIIDMVKGYYGITSWTNLGDYI